ncbi:MAG: hypothetical protein WEB62_03600, partial [Bacteroidota bacterium]
VATIHGSGINEVKVGGLLADTIQVKEIRNPNIEILNKFQIPIYKSQTAGFGFVILDFVLV